MKVLNCPCCDGKGSLEYILQGSIAEGFHYYWHVTCHMCGLRTEQILEDSPFLKEGQDACMIVIDKWNKRV